MPLNIVFVYLNMKKFIIILLTVLSFSFLSCKKHDYHKVTFEITFLGKPSTGSSNSIEVVTKPFDIKNEPYIDRFNLPKVWRYEYIGLEKKQKVYFSVRGQLSYYFEMKVYIDGVEQSYRRVRVSDNTYYADHVEESRGLNDDPNSDTGVITFIY